MNLFYAQYASIEPWLKKTTKLTLGEKQMFQTEKEREKLVRYLVLYSKICSLNFPLSLAYYSLKEKEARVCGSFIDSSLLRARLPVVFFFSELKGREGGRDLRGKLMAGGVPEMFGHSTIPLPCIL